MICNKCNMKYNEEDGEYLEQYGNVCYLCFDEDNYSRWYKKTIKIDNSKIEIIADNCDIGIWGLFIEPSKRKKGYAKLLLKKALKIAIKQGKKMGYDEIVLKVEKKNKALIKFYNSFDFFGDWNNFEELFVLYHKI